VIALVLLLAAAFGAGDQYLGSLVHHPWGADVASLSAPWVLLAFLAGATQRNPWRAALLGLGSMFAALVGYFLLTDSPLEGAQYTLANTHGFLVSNAPVILGGIVTGPLFGWFGQQWRTRRAVVGALVTAACLCLEPLARKVTIDPITYRDVWIGEVAVGLALAAAVLAIRFSNRFSHTSQA
jgi:hypothetical protein